MDGIKFDEVGRALRRPTRSLVQDLVNSFVDKIRAGDYPVGARLPTEAHIMQTYSVSRTVVRESMSRLQASHLVETRHGVGTFVKALPPGEQTTELPEVTTLRDVLAILELRIGLESESAALAAGRRSSADVARLYALAETFRQQVERDENSVDTDFQLHCAIAKASGNRYFEDFCAYMGTKTVPRVRVDVTHLTAEPLQTYLLRIHQEHLAIIHAIEAGDPAMAHAAMRAHISNSRERLLGAMQAGKV